MNECREAAQKLKKDFHDYVKYAAGWMGEDILSQYDPNLILHI